MTGTPLAVNVQGEREARGLPFAKNGQTVGEGGRVGPEAATLSCILIILKLRC